MTIKHKMSVEEILDKVNKVRAKRQTVIADYKAKKITMQELKARIKGLRIITNELERQRKKAKK